MKYFGIDRDVARAGDVHVRRTGFVTKAYRDFLGNAAAPVKRNRLQFRDEGDVVFQRKRLRCDHPVSAKIHRHAVRARRDHLHRRLTVTAHSVGASAFDIRRKLASSV